MITTTTTLNERKFLVTSLDRINLDVVNVACAWRELPQNEKFVFWTRPRFLAERHDNVGDNVTKRKAFTDRRFTTNLTTAEKSSWENFACRVSFISPPMPVHLSAFVFRRYPIHRKWIFIVESGGCVRWRKPIWIGSEIRKLSLKLAFVPWFWRGARIANFWNFAQIWVRLSTLSRRLDSFRQMYKIVLLH